ncbi:UPF0187 protein, partial [Durusdinium trenchii]
VLTYLFAILGCQTISREMLAQIPGKEEDELAKLLGVYDYVKGIGPLMQLLIQFLTLDSWNSKMDQIIPYANGCIIYFYMYIAVAVFVLMNLVTAIIVENAMSTSKMDENEKLKQMEDIKKKELKELEHLFYLMDADGDGTLDWEEILDQVGFENAFLDEEMSRKWRLLDFGPDECKEPGTMFTILGHGNPLMELIGPDGRLFRELFDLLDDGDGGIHTSEFFHGLARMKGGLWVEPVNGGNEYGAQSRDLMRVGQQVDRIGKELDKLIEAWKTERRSNQIDSATASELGSRSRNDSGSEISDIFDKKKKRNAKSPKLGIDEARRRMAQSKAFGVPTHTSSVRSVEDRPNRMTSEARISESGQCDRGLRHRSERSQRRQRSLGRPSSWKGGTGFDDGSKGSLTFEGWIFISRPGYNPWGRYRGSVLPLGALFALPSTLLTAILHITWNPDLKGADNNEVGRFGDVWTAYTFSLGFLVVFRNNQAYSRFWEGASKVHEIRGELYNCASTLVAFCSNKQEMQEEVSNFQHFMIRLISLLFATAMSEICYDSEDEGEEPDRRQDVMQVIDLDGIDESSLRHLQDADNFNKTPKRASTTNAKEAPRKKGCSRCEVIMQWITKLMINNLYADKTNEQGVLKIPPPILNRSLTDLSNAIVDIYRVRKIREVPFPFPYSQMVILMLTVYTLVTPVLSSQLIENIYMATMATFCVTTAFWSLYHIADEIDQPFGTDPNDLPMKEIQEDFNNSLLFLMEEKTQMVPKFTRWKRDMRITHVVKHDHSSCHVGSPAVAALPPTKIGIDRPAEAVNEAEAAAFASQPSGLTRKPKVRRQRRVKSQSETEAEAQATWDAASSAAVVAIEEVQMSDESERFVEEQAAKSGLEEQQSVEERRHSGSSMNPPQLMSHVPIDGDRVVLLDYPVTADGEEMTERMRTFVAESDGDGEVVSRGPVVLEMSR